MSIERSGDYPSSAFRTLLLERLVAVEFFKFGWYLGGGRHSQNPAELNPNYAWLHTTWENLTDPLGDNSIILAISSLE